MDQERPAPSESDTSQGKGQVDPRIKRLIDGVVQGLHIYYNVFIEAGLDDKKIEEMFDKFLVSHRLGLNDALFLLDLKEKDLEKFETRF